MRTIDHAEQRYPTTGDWWTEWTAGVREFVLQVRVSSVGDWRKEMLVAHHEITEALLCIEAGIDGGHVDAFDIEFEKARTTDFDASTTTFMFRGKQYDADAEPGDSADAPYYKQHQIATGFERVMAAEMKVDWNLYEQANLDLYN